MGPTTGRRSARRHPQPGHCSRCGVGAPDHAGVVPARAISARTGSVVQPERDATARPARTAAGHADRGRVSVACGGDRPGYPASARACVAGSVIGCVMASTRSGSPAAAIAPATSANVRARAGGLVVERATLSASSATWPPGGGRRRGPPRPPRPSLRLFKGAEQQ